MTRRDIHPRWCGRGHVCSAETPAGEHRSPPVTVHIGTSRLVVTRIRTVAGADRLEVRAVLTLPAEARAAEKAARWRLHRLVHAITEGGRP